jgi:hypothetical protein
LRDLIAPLGFAWYWPGSMAERERDAGNDAAAARRVAAIGEMLK